MKSELNFVHIVLISVQIPSPTANHRSLHQTQYLLAQWRSLSSLLSLLAQLRSLSRRLPFFHGLLRSRIVSWILALSTTFKRRLCYSHYWWDHLLWLISLIRCLQGMFHKDKLTLKHCLQFYEEWLTSKRCLLVIYFNFFVVNTSILYPNSRLWFDTQKMMLLRSFCSRCWPKQVLFFLKYFLLCKFYL